MCINLCYVVKRPKGDTCTSHIHVVRCTHDTNSTTHVHKSSANGTMYSTTHVHKSSAISSLPLKLGYSRMQTAARSRADTSGESHVGKKGFMMYALKVSATIVCEHGLTIRHSTQRRMKAKKGPNVTMMYA